MNERVMWPADKVERRPIATLIPYAENARVHTEHQIERIAASIREWGFTVPILVDEDDVVIAGHGRILAAMLLKLESLPVMVARGWTETQIKAYRIADNHIAELSTWDSELLAADMASLDPEYQALTGYEGDDLTRVLAGAGTKGLTDPDEVPPLPDVPTSRNGDLWILGNHRLLCGDCTAPDNAGRLMDGVKPGLMVTDPPYGVAYDADWRNHALREDGSVIGGRAVGKVANDEQADWRLAFALFPGQVAYVWHAGLFASEVEDSLKAEGFEIRSQIIWAKNRFVISRGNYHWQHEPCWYAVRKGNKASWHGGRSQSTLWTIEHQKSETGHSTQKPVECMRRPIISNSSPGHAVYDPFVGSGTTIIAAEMEARSCLAMELMPPYVDVAVKRWEAFTGETAALDDGRSFAEVEAERQAEA